MHVKYAMVIQLIFISKTQLDIFSHHSIFVKVLIKCRAIIGEGVGIAY